MGQKFCRNRSISLRFLDKHVSFTQKFKMAARKNNFGGKSPVDSAYTLRVKNFVEITRKRFWRKLASRLCRYPRGKKIRRNRSSSLCFRDKHIFAFYGEIQDGRQKSREKDFWRKFASRLCIYPESKISSKLL